MFDETVAMERTVAVKVAVEEEEEEEDKLTYVEESVAAMLSPVKSVVIQFLNVYKNNPAIRLHIF